MVKRKKYNASIIFGVCGGLIFIIIVSILFATQPWKPDYLSGKYEDQYKTYTHDCMDMDNIGELSINSAINKVYGSWSFVACTCSYLEYHNHYGDKDLPKTEITISLMPLKKKEVYDAASVFKDSSLKTKISDCIKKEMESKASKKQ